MLRGTTDMSETPDEILRTLRRALVDEGLLDRDHGEYWRAGGPVDAR